MQRYVSRICLCVCLSVMLLTVESLDTGLIGFCHTEPVSLCGDYLCVDHMFVFCVFLSHTA